MPDSVTDVLVVGAGPVGLTVACELRRHGVRCRIVDRLTEPPQYAKAVGIQPRTLEVWDDMGVLDRALDEAIALRGQIVYVNGEQVSRMELELPPEVPFGFVALPQYVTERLLSEHLAGFGCSVERGCELDAFVQDGEGVTATLGGAGRRETVRASFLVGADGAHSAVRKGLGLAFEGEAFPEEYMLGDVEVDWSVPRGMGVRSMHKTADGTIDDFLVAIPLPGDNRYRMSMLVSPDLATPARSSQEHGLLGDRPGPTLAHIQAVLDRLAPEKTTASKLRWSSVFRISHRLVDRYAVGRVFVAGDAAHIHPPTGAQGMNTGIQDAYNLAWKLALAAGGVGQPRLTASYHAERHPVGEEVVGRTVRHARSGFEADPTDPRTMMLREAQLLVGYPDSPIVAEDVDGDRLHDGPKPGGRAPDACGLPREGSNARWRVLELLRGPQHVLLLYADDAGEGLDEVAASARKRAHGRLRVLVVVPPESPEPRLRSPIVRDTEGAFRAAYGVEGRCAYLVRPDGYVAYRQSPIHAGRLAAHLGRTFI